MDIEENLFTAKKEIIKAEVKIRIQKKQKCCAYPY